MALSLYRTVRPSTIACERDILKTACPIDIILWHHLHITKTSDTLDLGHSTKNKMAGTAFWGLTLYRMQDIACERGRLKPACRIDFTFYIMALLINTTKTSDAIDLGHSTKNKMAATAVWRSTLYPMQDIACERLKSTCLIDFIFWYGLYIGNTLDVIDLGSSTKNKMASTAVGRLTLYPIQCIACEYGSLKTACRIDFTFWYGFYTSNTSGIIHLLGAF